METSLIAGQLQVYAPEKVFSLQSALAGSVSSSTNRERLKWVGSGLLEHADILRARTAVVIAIADPTKWFARMDSVALRQAVPGPERVKTFESVLCCAESLVPARMDVISKDTAPSARNFGFYGTEVPPVIAGLANSKSSHLFWQSSLVRPPLPLSML